MEPKVSSPLSDLDDIESMLDSLEQK